MRADSGPPRISYVLYFRTSRGAGGVYHETARAELLAAARHLPITILRETPAFNRLRLRIPSGMESDLLALMTRLGYAEALARITRYFGEGADMEHREPVKVQRWLVGEYRRGDDRVVHELIWQADEEARMVRSPHRRRFKMRLDGHVEATLRRRSHRRLSCCDAMLMLNLARVNRGALVIDPFAGIGGIALEARRMGLRCLCGDIARRLAPGLREVAGGLAAIWDATHLPLPDASADAVVTEPPYDDDRQGDVTAAMPEIARLLRPTARTVVLLKERLVEGPLRAAERAGLTLQEQYPVRRAGGMKARVLVLSREDRDG